MKKAFDQRRALQDQICRADFGEELVERRLEVGQASVSTTCVNILVEKMRYPETNRPFPMA